MISASFWSFAGMNQFLAAIPYTQNAAATGPYIWANQGAGSQFQRPLGSPGCRVGAVVSQFLFLGDLYQQQQPILFTGNGSQNTYSGTLLGPMTQSGQILDQQGTISGTFSNGVISGSGVSGTINYETGALTLTFSSPPPTGDIVYAQYIQSAPYRCQWSAIGNPIGWPTPLTNAALAVQSGFNDLDVALGPVLFVAGYPLYGLVFQSFGITRASYIGGNVVFSWQPYEFKRGCIAHGAAVKVGSIVYFLADDGFYSTDGGNVISIGTAPDNSGGMDKWFWANVNAGALESIRAGYDATKRCVFFSIPTGVNTLPDTLLSYNPAAQRWTKSSVSTEDIFTATNAMDGTPATKETLGVIDQTHTPNTLTGAPLTGYLESCDLFYTDGQRRLVTGARPHVNSNDNPVVVIGARNALEDAVTYGAASSPDPFSRIAPAMSGGIYTRARVQSGSASSIQGVTLLTETQGSI